MKPKSRACVTNLDVFEFKGLPTPTDWFGGVRPLTAEETDALFDWLWPELPVQLDLFYCNPSEIGRKK